tara:strand:- start:512 stop:763 length:252 start_codon:yes stop_codon:yes gene_type:complete
LSKSRHIRTIKPKTLRRLGLANKNISSQTLHDFFSNQQAQFHITGLLSLKAKISQKSDLGNPLGYHGHYPQNKKSTDQLFVTL